jgi:hypothetical protein
MSEQTTSNSEVKSRQQLIIKIMRTPVHDRRPVNNQHIPPLIKTRPIAALLRQDYNPTESSYSVPYFQDDQNLFDGHAPFIIWAAGKNWPDLMNTH